MEWIYEEIIEVGRLLFREGLVSARAGNISRAFGDRIFITRTGSFMGALSREDIISLPLRETTLLDERASIELEVHRRIILETGKPAVVHAHPPHAVTLSISKDLIIPVDSEGRDLIGEVKVLSLKKPSASKELAEAASEALKNSKVVLIRGHGAFAADRELKLAYAHISTLEHSCKILMWRTQEVKEWRKR